MNTVEPPAAPQVPSARREVLLALFLGALTAAVLALLEIPIASPAVAVGLAAAAAASVVDLREKRLPNRLLLPANTAVLVLLALAAVVDGELARGAIALGSGAAALLFYGLIWWLRPAALGYGDVKLAGLLGMITGWLGASTALTAVVLAFAVASVFALGLLLAGKSRATEIPFGPFMTAGALAAAALHLLGLPS